MKSLSQAWVIAAIAYTVRACIEAHTYFEGSFVQDDRLTMQVWVNEQLICSFTDGVYLSTNESQFCARNSDGAGSGCAAGYSFCVTEWGRSATFNYYENNEVAWTIDLASYDFDSDVIEDCLCKDDGEEASCLKCPMTESVLTSSQPCTNAIQPELCDYKAECGKTGLSDDPADMKGLTPFPYLSSKLMIVGDSISHGTEYDWTWRYRLWQWLQDQGYDVQFVGPYAGTHGPLPPSEALPDPPLLPGETAAEETIVTGLYAPGVPGEFGATGHAAWWGRQAHQDVDQIQGWVETYQPDYVLLLLGFNDLGWFVNGPDGLIDDMDLIVSRARAAKPDVNLLVGNVVQRSFIGGREDLVENTITYNNDLLTAVLVWKIGSSSSAISYVDVAGNYACSPDSCTDGYDGLHPAAIGEFHIAQEFANVLRDDFKILGSDFSVPTPPARAIVPPSGFAVQAVPEGILSSWSQVHNARGYNIRMRLEGMTDWWSSGAVYPSTWASYFTWCLSDQTWEVQVQTTGDFESTTDWTGSGFATCNPQTSQGPDNIVVKPSGSDSVIVSWDAVSGYSVNRYEVIVWDKDTDGAFIQGYGVAGTSYTVTGLNADHDYGVWVATWVNLADGNDAGGLPASARDVIVGEGAPSSAPSSLGVVNLDPTTVQLTWEAASGPVAGYAIYYRSLLDSTLQGELGTTASISQGIAYLYPGTWHYEFCVTAYNGNLESTCTAWVNPPVYPGYRRRAMAEAANGTDSDMLSPLQGNTTSLLYNPKIQKLWDLQIQNATALAPSTPY
ncbi:Fibronectin type III domain protein [Pleurostoma richardsiae]|uniref:Fibronectin type III domain protein n=1 Tax=Pleurostoma richardsiae TaxID=41990 RepID=A0AA38RDN9_9PEZI|nr:Fibronectin type III domain protein [Pleurostoma richardsiae]